MDETLRVRILKSPHPYAAIDGVQISGVGMEKELQFQKALFRFACNEAELVLKLDRYEPTFSTQGETLHDALMLRAIEHPQLESYWREKPQSIENRRWRVRYSRTEPRWIEVWNECLGPLKLCQSEVSFGGYWGGKEAVFGRGYSAVVA